MNFKDRKDSVEISVKSVIEYSIDYEYSPLTMEYIVKKVVDSVYPVLRKRSEDNFDVMVYDTIISVYRRIEGELPDIIDEYVRNMISLEVIPVPVWGNTLVNRMKNKIMYTRDYNISDLLAHNYDAEIMREIKDSLQGYGEKKANVSSELQFIRRNSVSEKEKDTKIQYQPKMRKMSRQSLLLLLSAISSFSQGLENVARDTKKFTEESKSKLKVDEVDDFDYPLRRYFGSLEIFEATVQNVLDFYDKVSKYDNVNYNYLGLYRAYDHITHDKLAIMNGVLHILKKRVAADAKYSELYNKMLPNNSYLSFIYDRLCDMGCEEIQEEKYASVIGVYEGYLVDYPGEVSYELLTSHQKKLVNEILKLYGKYSEQYTIMLGTELRNEEELTDSNRRKR